MGKQDISMKEWLRNKERFADLFNGSLFEGKPVVKAEDLEYVDRISEALLTTPDNKVIAVERHRDLVMRWNRELDLAILACENQEKVHYAMPVRTMFYDSLSYTDQMRIGWQGLTEEEKRAVGIEERFSRFRKEDKLYPVITLVLYHGEEPWDGSRTLYELFRLDHEELAEVLHKYVPNYWINLIDVSDITQKVEFQTDLQILFEMLQYRQDRQRLLAYIDEHRPYFSKMDYESRLAMITLLHLEKQADRIMKEEEREQDMCKALQDWYDEAMEIGMEKGIEQGIEQGIERGRDEGLSEGIRNSIVLLRQVGSSEDVIKNLIMKQYELPEEKVVMYM